MAVRFHLRMGPVFPVHLFTRTFVELRAVYFEIFKSFFLAYFVWSGQADLKRLVSLVILYSF